MDRSTNNISSNPPVSLSSSHRLEAKQLTLAYDSTAIVRNLNIAIPTGKTTVLVGANGCGKSTLLRGLAKLLKPKSGIVYLDGKNISQLKAKTVAKKLGMLPQSPVAPEGLTVKDLVAMGRYPLHENLDTLRSGFAQWEGFGGTLVFSFYGHAYPPRSVFLYCFTLNNWGYACPACPKSVIVYWTPIKAGYNSGQKKMKKK